MKYAKTDKVAYSHVVGEDERKTLCGKSASDMEVSSKPASAMCSKCRRRMKKPKG